MMINKFLATACLWLFSTLAIAAPSAELWDFWLKHDQSSTATIDHSAWDRYLQRYVKRSSDGINLINYANVSSADRTELKAYLQRLAAINIHQYNRAEQQTYWINLYNALTVDVILDHYPVKSIRDIDISPGFFSDGPWKKQLLAVNGKQVSLDDIEHRILRPIWKDPRIHYAVNCASIGCPNLQPQAFTADNSEQLLNQGAKDYINHPRGARFEGNDLHLSSIYKWFKEDFGNSESKLIEHLKQYANADLKEKLKHATEVSGYHYDWNLNEIGR
ncbi:DUF547 domain-containing protein [Neptuniibacter sp. QD34_54]|uniref:DUF547 domain-containing protein n=1 Tax=Neptuniibacter sp. QD34_54 TaxID=3398208 RepID=UPI0039F64199